ncbi:hypothetical protein [Neptuniibacter sp. QD37_11]|uniref:hypothetical protein n=1 Tax=Neptuniibacter sp. QD37_11 TaxID=3398209 RepID=UPI0039F5EB39
MTTTQVNNTDFAELSAAVCKKFAEMASYQQGQAIQARDAENLREDFKQAMMAINPDSDAVCSDSEALYQVLRNGDVEFLKVSGSEYPHHEDESLETYVIELILACADHPDAATSIKHLAVTCTIRVERYEGISRDDLEIKWSDTELYEEDHGALFVAIEEFIRNEILFTEGFNTFRKQPVTEEQVHQVAEILGL